MQQVRYRAAGGVVFHDGRILLLERPQRGEVRLPKGHLEEDETLAAAALREVREESGYVNLTILADLGVQQVRFIDPYEDRWVTRDEHYFLMVLDDEQRQERKAKEHEFVPVWVSYAEAAPRLTFESEQEFVRRALRWVAQNGL